MRRSFWFRFLMTIAMLSIGGGLLQVGSCAATVARNVNPCGTIFTETFCDPQAWDLLWVEVQDWERDPTCTIPTLCGTWPPTDTTDGGTTDGTTGG